MSAQKIISQQPNKIKVYIKLNAVGRKLRLDLIKRHILPKGAHSVIKLKLQFLKRMMSKLKVLHVSYIITNI